MKILVTGITGFLGPYLQSEFAKDPANEIQGVARGPEADYSYDLSDQKAVQHMMERLNPDVVIHAAAMTDVNRCQEHPEEAWAANVTATKNIVQYMPLRGKFVYISSDAVYSGQGPHWVNGETVNPVNIYGMTKYMGELEAARFPNHIIIRTTMVGVSRSRKKSSSLVDFLIDRFKSGERFGIFTDALFSPLYIETLAKLIRIRVSDNICGTINLAPRGGISKNRFALLVAGGLGLSAANAIPILSTSVQARAPRALDTRMASPDWDGPTIEQDIQEMCRAIKVWRPI